jgi:two-component system sensor kinase FixL
LIKQIILTPLTTKSSFRAFMPAFKKTLISLFLLLFCGIVALGMLFYRNRRIVPEAAYFLLVLGGIFGLVAIIFWLALRYFNRSNQIRARLSESEERFRLLVQEVKDYAIFMIDPEGRVMSWNQGAEHIKGYTEPEIIGKPISIFYTDEENQRGEPAYNLKRAEQDGHFESVGWRKRKDGTLFFADVFFTPLYDERGGLRGFAKITRDVTDQREVEEEMRKALRREKELNEMKSRFVSLASHEFKTPLSVILSSVSLIEKYGAPDMEDKRLKHVQRIKSNVNNLKQILNDFLSVEKLEEGVVRNCPVETDLVGLMQDMIQDMEMALKEGQEIRLQVSGAPHSIQVDNQLLRNALNNLFSNAIKYSPAHEAIDCSLDFKAGIGEIHIRDRGIGIPPEEQQQLFERFFRASNSTGISGTGLGLSIVKKFLDLMGAGISFQSAPGEGSTFTVVLPDKPA